LCGGLIWYARQFGVAAAPAAALAFALPMLLLPCLSDLLVGNVNGFQVLACAATTALAARLARGVGAQLATGSLLVALLVALVLFKPNLAPIAAVFALSGASALGWKRALITSFAGVAAGALLVAASSAYFGSSRAWLDWYQYLHGADASKLAGYTVAEGNCAPAVVFGDDPASAYRIQIALAALLAASASIALQFGRRGASWIERLRELGRDPHLAMTIAVLATLIVLPLVWFHYGVLALLPIYWCLFSRGGPGWRAWSGVLALFAYGAVLEPHLAALGMQVNDYGPKLFALAWIPIWLAVLDELARPTRHGAR
jgi:hypothetical protein